MLYQNLKALPGNVESIYWKSDTITCSQVETRLFSKIRKDLENIYFGDFGVKSSSKLVVFMLVPPSKYEQVCRKKISLTVWNAHSCRSEGKKYFATDWFTFTEVKLLRMVF